MRKPGSTTRPEVPGEEGGGPVPPRAAAPLGEAGPGLAARVLAFFRETILRFVGGTLGLSPNALTGAGLAISLASAWLYARGTFFWAGVVLLISVLCDVFDGLVAKRYGKMTAFGSFLDSCADRYIEIFQFAGLFFYYNATGRPSFAYIALFYVLGSFLTSYTRAKIESLGQACRAGWFQRLERMTALIILSAGAAFDDRILFWGLAAVGAAANVTALERIVYGRRVFKSRTP